jgi:hypothetical protein
MAQAWGAEERAEFETRLRLYRRGLAVARGRMAEAEDAFETAQAKAAELEELIKATRAVQRQGPQRAAPTMPDLAPV